MAFFKFRLPGQAPSSSAVPDKPESVDALRRRAKHRLMGSVVLVLAAVIGFPLIFDAQPRPVAVDVPITIPDRNKAKPPVMPAAPTGAAPAIQQSERPASLEAKESPVAPAPAKASPPVAPKAEPKLQAGAEPKSPPKTDGKPVPTVVASAPANRPDDGSRARALLEGSAPVAVPTEGGRFIVQVGAFADASKAHEVRLKVERAGLKTYTHVAETKEGPRTRVRVGPFASRAEADSAAVKLRALDLAVAVLSL